MRKLWTLVGVLCTCCTVATAAQPESWPQFRGANAAGTVAVEHPLPEEIGPEQNVIWKVELPAGHSSPIVYGDQIFVTAARKVGEKEAQLLTIGLDRKTGKVQWEALAPHDRLEDIHRIGSYAQPSPATDGERVVSFFGSSGLLCYSIDGKLLWKQEMGPFKNDFGAGSSPIISGDCVILCQDHDTNSFLAAFDKRTGKQLWKTDRSEFARNYCTPVIWEVDGQKQIVLAATLRVVGYDFNTGKELWTVRGISRVVCMTPVLGDGLLFVAGWAAGGDAGGERIQFDPFDDVVAEFDKNKNGSFEEEELPEGPVQQRFSQCDRDKDKLISRLEYENFRALFDKSQNLVGAIQPGGKGDVSETHLLWKNTRFVPFCASPLFYKGRLFTVKDGGILSSLDARTGKASKTARVPGTGDYYSSPVAGDGKIYLLNEEGKLTVVSADPEWEVLSTSDFGDSVYSTPAIVDGRIYLRTTKHLFCFGKSTETAGK